MSEEIEKHYQMQGKELVDKFFDTGTFNDKLTRDDLNSLEDVIAYYLQSNVKSAIRVHDLTQRIKNR